MVFLRFFPAYLLLIFTLQPFSQPYSILESLANTPNYETHRISSFDQTGGNADRYAIQPGETRILAEV